LWWEIQFNIKTGKWVFRKRGIKYADSTNRI